MRRTNARDFTGSDISASPSLCLSRFRARRAGLSRGLSTVWHITRDARSGLRGRTGRTGGATLGAGTHGSGPGQAAYRACNSSGSTRCHAAANTRRVRVERQKLHSLINPRLGDCACMRDCDPDRRAIVNC